MFGIESNSLEATINGNTINNANSGIGTYIPSQLNYGPSNPTTAATIANNVLFNDDAGLSISSGTITAKGNKIVSSGAGFGMYLGCNTNVALSGNLFIGTATAVGGVPDGLALTKNAGKYIGVPTIETLCP